jgi:regulator of protease activity HflC (stomatin/prohibitin superfamily)
MKNLFLLLLVAFAALSLTSCESVNPGERGVYVKWGGEPDMNKVYPEGLHWVGFDDIVQYDIREKTIVERFVFNDKSNMSTGVEIALDYNLNANEVHHLHTRIADVQTKIKKNLKSAAKEVVPQYTASDLNLKHRQEAEQALTDILSKELPEFHVNFARVQITDVDIPTAVAAIAEKTAVQLERNELASKKEEEEQNIAKAKIAKAEGDYKAAQFDAKTKAILSDSKMLKLKELELEEKRIEVMRAFANKGVSPYGSHNVFQKIPMLGKLPN